MLDHVGQQVGNYRLLRLLGRGGFADVYLGEHRYLKSAAALKILRISLSEKDAQRFLEEAQTLVRLRHANIVRVLDFAIEDGTPVLIMDYIPGGSLREHHPRGTSLPLPIIVDYVEQIAAALQYAHNQHVIHRDVKSENILLDMDQHLVLSDFGLALLTSAPNQLSTKELAGTLPYIAPEQVQGKPRFASDQYALGVLAYEWITGERPFKGTAFEVIQKHLTAPPPPLRERCPDLPAAVEQVVLKALTKDPSNRYSSVTAFAHALKRSCLDGTQHDEDSESTVPLGPTPRFSAHALDHSRSNRSTLGKVFLSAAPSDEMVMARLVGDLKQRGVLLSNDFSEKVSGQEEALRQAVRSAHRVVIVVTPQTRTSRLVKEHLHLAQVYQRRLVLVWMQGEEMTTLLLDQIWKSFRLVDVVDAREERYQAALEELLVCLREETPLPPLTTETDIMTLEELPEPRNPYKGLRAFRQDEATDFFGREALIAAMMEQLKSILETERRGAAGTRLLAMVGPSGSGKSSAMLAGLLPQLQMGALPGSKAWVYLEPMVPGTHPLEALALTLALYLPDRPMKTIHEDLQDDSARGLHRLCMQMIKRPDSRVVLIVDQFEELFTQTMAEAEQRYFIDLLITAVTEVHGPVLVLLTLRADFYDRPMRYPHLYRLIEAHHKSILPMEIDELRQVIEKPADLPDVQLTFEGNLLGDLLFEAQGQIGALPLLEFTLDQLFQRRDGHTLTVTAYREMGGVKGALVRHAESTYASLPSNEHRSFARVLFMRLVNLGMTDQDTTRRRATLSELSLPDAKQTAILQEVTDTFIAARLLTTNELAGIITIEVSHEALLREWERLSNWLREGREDIRFQQAISSDVDTWEQRAKPKDRLYHGSRLKEARAWARRNKPSKQEAAFLRASALRQAQFVVSMTVIFLLLLSTAGAAIGFFLLLPPDPTLVTNRNDDGSGSLRWAINSAKKGSTIRFAPDVRGTIWLKSKDLVFSQSLTIQGPGASALTISSGNSGYVIQVLDGNSVTLSDLSFKNSNTGKTKYGFLYNQGTLQLRNTTISGNTSSDLGLGGGIYNDKSSTLTLINSTVSNNSAQYGGGIYNYQGTLTVTNSTISGNKAVGKNNTGGGILDTGQLYLANSTISGNMTDNNGGGITFFGDQATVTFCTIYDNTAQNGGGLSIQNVQERQSHVKIRNSIVAGNHAPVGADIAGTLTSDGYNLIQDDSPAYLLSENFAQVDLIGMSPNVGPLQNNRGLTETHALAPGSPAIDKVPLKACQIEAIFNSSSKTYTDQREVKRPQGSSCDIGAYEAVPSR
jgi:serine/threonine protein kinase/type II secretory pathway predicted ATPase ExeA